MKKSLTLRLVIFSCLTSLTAFAALAGEGAVSGGGGKVVVCRNPDRSIKSVELLDLWEARVLYGRKIGESQATVDMLVQQGIENLKFLVLNRLSFAQGSGKPDIVKEEAFKKELLWRVGRFLKHDPHDGGLKRLHGVKLTDTADSYEVARPSDCDVEQVINYLDMTGRAEILINQDLVNAMDNVNQAALFLHEALYSFLRRDSLETNSIRTRRAIGIVASGEGFLSRYKFLLEKHIVCESPATHPMTTRIHFVNVQQPTRTGTSNGVAVIAERVGGVLTMGLTAFNTWIVGDVDEVFRKYLDPKMKAPRKYQFRRDLRAENSIDFELDGYLGASADQGEAPVVFFVLERTTNGRATPVNEPLVCRLTNQDD